ncbi:MAG: hypothetical protein WAM28_06740 [Chlamydiales bacterium]
MKKRLGITFWLLTTLGYASSFYNEPWLPPLWEFQSLVGFFYEHENRVQTPKGSFNEPANDYVTQLSLAVTPWPDWYVQADVLITKTTGIPFSYESSFWTVRRLWLDGLNGDLFTLATGVVAFFPGNRYLSDLSSFYHGNANVEFEIIIGKEWAHGEEWFTRVWALGGIGTANRGMPWIPIYAVWEFNLNDCQLSLYTDMLFGLGRNDIIPDRPFKGYALIGHRNIDLGAFLTYQLGCFGSLVVEGWYNIYAHNSIENYFGGGVSLIIPFGF